MTLGEKIRARRIERKMTMDDLAKQIGVQRSAIHKYEKGIVINLKYSTLRKLAKALDVSLVYLFDDNNSEIIDRDNRLLNAFHAASAEARELALNMLEQSASMHRK